jgi:Leucine-rich repeat (LRR) protein
MEALWLNDNLLTKIEGLDTNVQLKALYLHDNRISTLKGSLKYLKHIEMLALQNNRLTDLEATLKGMEHLTRLEELDLSGNPLANEVLKKEKLLA